MTRQWKPEPRKTYATIENAVKAADGFCAVNEVAFKSAQINPRFVVIAVGDRFTPMFFHTGSMPIWFAHAGFAVTN